jgi:hypothetical protein
MKRVVYLFLVSIIFIGCGTTDNLAVFSRRKYLKKSTKQNIEGQKNSSNNSLALYASSNDSPNQYLKRTVNLIPKDIDLLESSANEDSEENKIVLLRGSIKREIEPGSTVKVVLLNNEKLEGVHKIINSTTISVGEDTVPLNTIKYFYRLNPKGRRVVNNLLVPAGAVLSVGVFAIAHNSEPSSYRSGLEEGTILLAGIGMFIGGATSSKYKRFKLSKWSITTKQAIVENIMAYNKRLEEGAVLPGSGNKQGIHKFVLLAVFSPLLIFPYGLIGTLVFSVLARKRVDAKPHKYKRVW